MTRTSAVGLAWWLSGLSACGARSTGPDGAESRSDGADVSQSADSEASESNYDDTMTRVEGEVADRGDLDNGAPDANAVDGAEDLEEAIRPDASEADVPFDACAPGMETTQCGSPTFVPDGGNIGSVSTVRIVPPPGFPSCGSIYYTTDGTMPTHSSAVYTRPIRVDAAETIYAIANAGSICSDSVPASAAFTVAVADGGSG